MTDVVMDKLSRAPSGRVCGGASATDCSRRASDVVLYLAPDEIVVAIDDEVLAFEPFHVGDESFPALCVAEKIAARLGVRLYIVGNEDKDTARMAALEATRVRRKAENDIRRVAHNLKKRVEPLQPIEGSDEDEE